MNRLASVLLALLLAVGVSGQVVEGSVRDGAGEALPFAGVYVKDSTYGTSTTRNGSYTLTLNPGTYVLEFSHVGFASTKREVRLARGEQLRLDVSLVRAATQIGTAEVVADTRDKAKEIMRKVRDRRPAYLDAVQTYACETYHRSTLMREPKNYQPLAATGLSPELLDSAGIEVEEPEYLLMRELVSNTQFRAASRYQEHITAIQKFKEGDIPEEPMRSMSASGGANFGDPQLVPWAREARNAYLVFEDLLSCGFNFYENTFPYDAIAERQLTSPIAAGSALLYRYDYAGAVYEAGQMVHKLQVTPLSKGEPLFEGALFVADSSYALVAVDLRVNRAAMTLCKEFHIVQNYEEIAPGIWLPVRRELTYHIGEGSNNIVGRATLEHSGYVVNQPLPKAFSPTEVRRYDPKAFDRDTTFWQTQRPAVLNVNDLMFMQHADSVRNYLQSDEWLQRQDSVYNVIDIWTPLVGYGYRNRAKGVELYIEGLLGQINPFGIGGYRHRLPAEVSLELKGGYTLETNGFVDYGFANNDIKGRISAGLTYRPLKFVRTMLTFGDYYEMVNDYASIEQIFSRSNFIRTTEYGISQRQELINGLFAEASFTFEDQQALVGLQLADWSSELFGDLNTPLDFARYKKSEFRLRMQYNIRQRYEIKRGRKLILGSDYPELYLEYRKGVPGLFGSEVNFDYLEIGASHELDLVRYGSSRWQVQMGTYLNKANLRILEYKYFRGSDQYFFSDPLRSFQLLGPTLNTPNEWFQASYIHHFDGTLLGKVPLVNLLKLQLAAGGGVLSIPDSGFNHGEMFAGLERNFRIKGQLLRFGAYAVTADNTLAGPNLRYKFGFAFYDSFRRKWDY